MAKAKLRCVRVGVIGHAKNAQALATNEKTIDGSFERGSAHTRRSVFSTFLTDSISYVGNVSGISYLSPSNMEKGSLIGFVHSHGRVHLPHDDIIFIFNVDRVCLCHTTGRFPLALGACVCFLCRTLAYLGATA